MRTRRRPDLDLLAFAEDVAAGRRSLDNVIDQIAVATPDDRERRRSVAELNALVLGLTGVRAHARATAAALGTTVDPARQTLVVGPGPVTSRGRRLGLGGTFAAGATAVGAVILIALVAGSLRPSPSVSTAGGPTSTLERTGTPPVATASAPAPSSASAPAPSPVSTPAHASVAPTGSAVASSPTPAAPAPAGLPAIPITAISGPGSAWWSLTAHDTVEIWTWQTEVQRMVVRLAIDTWPGAGIQRTVLVSPDGSRVAIQEMDTTTNSPVQRVRIFGMGGAVEWTAPHLPLVTAMAWSPDSTALAIGSLPVPWTVVQLNQTGAPEITTYNLDDQDGYALLGFSEDSNTLYGYGTGGEADFWDKPIALNRARGTLTHLDGFPASEVGLSLANATAPVGQVARGRVVALAGGARGDLRWVIRDGAMETPIAIGPDVQVTWGADALVALSRDPVTDDNGLGVRRLDLSGQEQPGTVTLPAGRYAAVLVGARQWYVLVSLIPTDSQREAQPVREVLLVDLVTGAIAAGVPPDSAQGLGFTFAGWLGDASPSA